VPSESRRSNPLRKLWTVLFLLLLWTTATAGPGPKVQTRSLQHQGLERTFHVVVPDSAQPGAPMVLLLHGGGGRGDRVNRAMGYGPSREAAERGWVLVTPDGHDKSWNDGREVFENVSPSGQPIDDLGFLNKLVDQLAAEGTIDPNRVFVMGMSNGGHMAYSLAVHRADRFHTIAPLISNLPKGMDGEAPSRPVSVLVMNGTKDPLIPYNGGEVVVFGKNRGQVRSTDDTIAWWAQHNQCPSPPEVLPLKDRDPNDGIQTVMETRRNCADGSEVTLVRVEGGGHTWPGGPQYLPEKMIGPTSNDVDAVRMAFRFFDRHVPNGGTER
jgi:polyhydroxybutyrate depolymerase